ncbi:Protein of unknown function [Lachnospiraceae bacterium KHCPX20]|nr:Protein of unknown function [Lachnospiraceae bacterium KHCPX20]
MSQFDPQPGEKFRHFKGNLYQIICRATHSETNEDLVIYQALYGDFGIYARPCSMFTSEVDHDKYPDVAQQYRFMLLSELKKQSQMTELTKKEAKDIATAVSSLMQEEAEEEDDYVPDQDPAMVHMLKFLDTDDFEEKYRIVKEMAVQNELNDTFIDNMAASMDLVIGDGPLEDRTSQLMICISTRKRFESTRLR